EGLGVYTPTIDLSGTIKVGHRADPVIKKRLNAPGAFKGEILHREHIGKSGDDLVAMWNAEHPDDPVS
ncbi:MAG: hypothetical protein D6681_19375, partial [Calditrichaeota bacterium]